MSTVMVNIRRIRQSSAISENKPLRRRGQTCLLYTSGDEGGFAPDFKDAKEALQFIVDAVRKAGYEPRKDIVIALDAAATESVSYTHLDYFDGDSCYYI